MKKSKLILAALLVLMVLYAASASAIEITVEISGEWHRTNVDKYDRATIIILNATEKSFDFSFEGFHAANMGEMEGTAAFAAKNKAACDYKDEDREVKLKFVLDGDLLSVSAEGDMFGLFGMGVYIGGEYTKGEPAYTNANIVEEVLGYNTRRVKQLLGKNVFKRLVSVMEEGVPSKVEGLTFSCFVNGAGEGADLLFDGDKIYCLGLNLDEEEGYVLYTNDERYKEKLPDAMKENVNEEWPLEFAYKDLDFKIDDNLYGMFNAILASVYESEIDWLTVSPYKYNLLEEEVEIYSITCKNERECHLAVKSDGRVFINENEDTPNFKRVMIGNLIFIGKPVNNYDHVNYDMVAQEAADGLFEKPGKAVPFHSGSEYAKLIIDHRLVRVYGIHYEFDVGPFIAIDDTTEYVYCSPTGNQEEYFRVIRDMNGAYSIGEKVSVTSTELPEIDVLKNGGKTPGTSLTSLRQSRWGS